MPAHYDDPRDGKDKHIVKLIREHFDKQTDYIDNVLKLDDLGDKIEFIENNPTYYITPEASNDVLEKLVNNMNINLEYKDIHWNYLPHKYGLDGCSLDTILEHEGVYYYILDEIGITNAFVKEYPQHRDFWNFNYNSDNFIDTKYSLKKYKTNEFDECGPDRFRNYIWLNMIWKIAKNYQDTKNNK